METLPRCLHGLPSRERGVNQQLRHIADGLMVFDQDPDRNASGEISPDAALLSVQGLNVDLPGSSGPRNVLCDLSFEVRPGETFALVGESGGGKSITCLAVMGLLGSDVQVTGSIRFQGRQLLGSSARAQEELRGSGIGMVFQDASTALNPVRTLGSQLIETLARHAAGPADHRREACRLLGEVGLPDAEKQLGAYAHELSGGQCQRAMIAMALAARPKLLIADEPTSALDVTIQAQILDLLQSLSRERQMALLLVTHDLGIVAQYADRVAVLYAGSIVETAETIDFFERPAHPYARKLLAAVPRIDRPVDLLANIPGTVPAPGQRPQGCAFAPRCERTIDRCRRERPLATVVNHHPFHEAACFLAGEESSHA